MKKTPITLTLILFAVFLAYTCACIMIDVSTVELTAVYEGAEGNYDKTDVGFSSLNLKLKNALGYRETFYKLSNYLGYLALLTGFAIGCLWLYELIKTRRLLDVRPSLNAAMASLVLMAVFYALFEAIKLNYRPVILTPDEIEASYPSSHTLLGCTVFGCAALVAFDMIRDKALARSVVWLCAALAAVLALFRALSGVHWLSDIIGGLLLSGALVSFANFAREFIKEMPEHQNS